MDKNREQSETHDPVEQKENTAQAKPWVDFRQKYNYFRGQSIVSKGSLRGEQAVYVVPGNANAPFLIWSFGITHPDANYFIERKNCAHFVIEFVISGKGYVINGDKKFALESGDVYILEPGSTHRYYPDPKDPFEKIWINFQSDLFGQVLKAFNLSGITLFHDAECGECFERILRLKEISSTNDDIYCRAGNILFEIVTRLAERARPAITVSSAAEEIKQRLDGAILGNITVEQLCNELHISKSQLSREFKRQYATTPYQYLLDAKIRLAKRMILEGTRSVKEISELLGFADEHYFSNFFKMKTGVRPSAFRRL